MPAGQPVRAVLRREPRSRVRRFEIGPQTGPVVGQRATDDLFHLAMVKINARAEACSG